jgi:hypothetical protein
MNYSEQLLITKNLDREVILEGVKVPIIHAFGHDATPEPPKILLGELRMRLANLLMGSKIAKVLNNRTDIYTSEIIVEKFKDVYHAGIGNDAVNILAQRGYNFRGITNKLGYCALKEIHITHGHPIFYPVNLALNEGINQIWNLLRENDATNYYTNALARVGVGNSTTAASASQTGLQGGSTNFQAMTGGFPTHGTQRIDFKSSFASGQAEFAWEEFTVDNGSTPNHNLVRIVTSKGTKSSGETWTAEIRITGA